MGEFGWVAADIKEWHCLLVSRRIPAVRPESGRSDRGNRPIWQQDIVDTRFKSQPNKDHVTEWTLHRSSIRRVEPHYVCYGQYRSDGPIHLRLRGKARDGYRRKWRRHHLHL